MKSYLKSDLDNGILTNWLTLSGKIIVKIL